MGHANAHMKRLLSAALSLAMVLQVGATAFAVGSEEGISEAPAIVLDQDGTEESPATESDSSMQRILHQTNKAPEPVIQRWKRVPLRMIRSLPTAKHLHRSRKTAQTQRQRPMQQAR